MYLETVTGKVVNVIEPKPEQICIEDIAWGLSRMPRFCGHTITEIPYNVAQHSLFVAREVANICDNPHLYPKEIAEYVLVVQPANDLGRWKLELILFALLHDGSEIYTGDIPSPMKQIPELRPVIKKIEHNLMSAIYSAFGLKEPTDIQEAIVKHADKIAQKIEAHAFMQSRGNHWPNMPEVSLEKLQKFEAPMKALDSYKEFMAFFVCHFEQFQPRGKE